MGNMSFNDFLDTLTTEQREAILQCRTEEALEQVIDDYDIEIPDEMLVDVAGGKGGFFPMALAAVMLLAAGCGAAPRKLAPAEVDRTSAMPQVAAATAVAEMNVTRETTTAATTAVTAAVEQAFAAETTATPAGTTVSAPAETVPAATAPTAPVTTAAVTSAAATVTTTTAATAATRNVESEEKNLRDFFAAQQQASQNALEYVGFGYNVVSIDLLPGNGSTQEFKVGVAPEGDASLVTYLCAGPHFCITESEYLGYGASADARYFADKRGAEANVRAFAGPAFELVTCEALPNNDSANYFKVGVARRGTNSPITYWYAGTNFCKTEAEWLAPPAPTETPTETAEAPEEESGQNPIMNAIGTYGSERAVITVSALGDHEAQIRISWSSSAFDNAEWNMTGSVSQMGDKLIVTYRNCVKTANSYTADGTLQESVTQYTNGSGTVTFSGSRATWDDYAENIVDGQVFDYLP